MLLQLAVALSLTAAQQPEFVASVEGVSEYRLQNGLRILLYPEPSQQTVTVHMTYLTGSAHENYGETGAAHLLEHLMIKGSAKFPGIWQDLSNRAGPGDWNATTSFDRTSYYETFPAKSVADLRWALEMEADRMVNARIEKRFLDLEMTVVRNEWELSASDVNRSLQNAMTRTMFRWLNYAHPTLGARSDIEGMNIDRLVAFYKTYYQPDNAVLYIGGRFDQAQVLGWIGEYFGPIAAPARQLPRRYTIEPAQEGERSVTLRRAGGSINAVAAGYHFPPASHPGIGPAMLLYSILTEGPYSRIQRALRAKNTAGAVKSRDYLQRERSWFIMGVQSPASAPPHEIERTLIAAIENIASSEPPTAEEVNRARTSWLQEFQKYMDDPARFPRWLADANGWGDWRLAFLQRDWVRAATPEQVREVAAKYLVRTNRTMGFVLAESSNTQPPADLPEPVSLKPLLENYEGGTPVQPGEAFDATSANIESRTRYSTTPGGISMALLNKKTRGATAAAIVTLRLGSAESLKGKSAVAKLTAAMLLRGTTKRTGPQLQAEFDRLKATVSLRNRSAWTAGISISTSGGNLPAVLRLAAEVLREPAFNQQDLEQVRGQLITAEQSGAGNLMETASARLSNVLMTPFDDADPRKPLTAEASIRLLQAVTLDDVRKFHRDFYGGQAADFAAVGQFDAAAIPTLVAELFDGWRAPTAHERIGGPFVEVPPSRVEIDIRGQQSAVFLAGLNVQVHYDHPDFVKAWLGAWMFGMGSGNGRLMRRLRIQEGLSYGTNAWLDVQLPTSMSHLVLFAASAPQNLNKVEALILEEIAKFQRGEGFTAKELEAGRKSWLAFRETDHSQDIEVAASLSAAAGAGKTFAWQVAIDREAQQLTAEEVTAAFRKYLRPEKLTIVRAADLAKTRN